MRSVFNFFIDFSTIGMNSCVDVNVFTHYLWYWYPGSLDEAFITAICMYFVFNIAYPLESSG